MNDKLSYLLDKYKHIWKSEAAFMSWIRGGIRGGLWNKHPVKLDFIKSNRVQIPNPNPKGKKATVWGATCALTGNVVPISEIQVDHVVGGHSLKDISDIQAFIEAIVLVTDADLQLVSKEAHAVKSYAEKQGITFEDAVLQKKVIAFKKLSVTEQTNILQSLYDVATMKSLSNATKRAEAYKQHLLKERAND